MEKSRRQYEKYLDEVGLALGPEEWVIGGKDRSWSAYYGRMLRRHDPIAFEVGYREWKNNDD